MYEDDDDLDFDGCLNGCSDCDGDDMSEYDDELDLDLLDLPDPPDFDRFVESYGFDE